MFSINQKKQKFFLWNNSSAFPENVKALCNNNPAFEKAVLFMVFYEM